MPYNLNTFATLSDLAMQAGTELATAEVMGGLNFNDGSGGRFYWDPISTAAHNGVNVVQVRIDGIPMTTGRWIRSKSNVYGTGKITFSGLSLISTYTINHLQSFTPSQVQLQAITAGASSALSYVPEGSITSTTFQVVFVGIPSLGVNNISFHTLIVR